MIDVKNLHKAYGDHEVLKGVNEHIEKGEKVVVIGPSGSGKSTFLRCLNLLEEPTSGEIIFEGQNITSKQTDINLVRRRMGMVFQQFNLFPHLTVRENIKLAPVKLKVMTDEEADKHALELLARVDVVLRRYNKTDAVIEIGGLRIDTRAMQVWRGAEEIALTHKEYDLLLFFGPFHCLFIPFSLFIFFHTAIFLNFLPYFFRLHGTQTSETISRCFCIKTADCMIGTIITSRTISVFVRQKSIFSL